MQYQFKTKKYVDNTTSDVIPHIEAGHIIKDIFSLIKMKNQYTLCTLADTMIKTAYPEDIKRIQTIIEQAYHLFDLVYQVIGCNPNFKQSYISIESPEYKKITKFFASAGPDFVEFRNKLYSIAKRMFNYIQTIEEYDNPEQCDPNNSHRAQAINDYDIFKLRADVPKIPKKHIRDGLALTIDDVINVDSPMTSPDSSPNTILNMSSDDDISPFMMDYNREDDLEAHNRGIHGMPPIYFGEDPHKKTKVNMGQNSDWLIRAMDKNKMAEQSAAERQFQMLRKKSEDQIFAMEKQELYRKTQDTRQNQGQNQGQNRGQNQGTTYGYNCITNTFGPIIPTKQEQVMPDFIENLKRRTLESGIISDYIPSMENGLIIIRESSYLGYNLNDILEGYSDFKVLESFTKYVKSHIININNKEMAIRFANLIYERIISIIKPFIDKNKKNIIHDIILFESEEEKLFRKLIDDNKLEFERIHRDAVELFNDMFKGKSKK